MKSKLPGAPRGAWLGVAMACVGCGGGPGAADALDGATDVARGRSADAATPTDAVVVRDAGTDAARSSSFPSASNTGVPVGTHLTRVPSEATSGAGWHWDPRGWVHVDADGTTLDALDIDGSVAGANTGLTVRDTRIRCTDEMSWCVTLGAGSTITDSEIGGGSDGHTTQAAPAIYSGGTGAGNLIQRVNMHHVVHGPHLDGGTTMVDSYVHDLPMGEPGPFQTAHTDCIFISTGHGFEIRHNSFETGNSAEIFVQDYDRSAEGVGELTIEDNLFTNITRNGEVSSFGVACENKDIHGAVVIRNNTFSQGWQVGPIEAPVGATVVGNVFTDGTEARADFEPVVY